jgi:hypothetical protein
VTFEQLTYDIPATQFLGAPTDILIARTDNFRAIPDRVINDGHESRAFMWKLFSITDVYIAVWQSVSSARPESLGCTDPCRLLARALDAAEIMADPAIGRLQRVEAMKRRGWNTEEFNDRNHSNASQGFHTTSSSNA